MDVQKGEDEEITKTQEETLGLKNVPYLDCSDGFTGICMSELSKIYSLNVFNTSIKLLKINKRKVNLIQEEKAP